MVGLREKFKIACGPIAVILFATTNNHAYSQQIIEGGMRFTARNIDAMSFRSGSVSGLNARGSASVAGGSINTGSAASDVVSELNPLSKTEEGAPTLLLAGNQAQLSRALALQRHAEASGIGLRTSTVNRGELDENLKVILESNPRLVELVSKPNPSDTSNPYVNVQFTEDYDRLEALLDGKSTTGLHILSSSSPTSSHKYVPAASTNNQTTAWSSDAPIRANPRFAGYTGALSSPIEGADNVVRIASVGAVGTTGNVVNFSVVGFATNPNPSEGKTSTIAAFATNNRTVGSIRVPELINGQRPTLQDIATQFGTTVDQLITVNNLPSANIDIAGLNLTVPADLLTVDYHIVEQSAVGQTSETPRSLAKRFGINVSWLLDLNGWVDSEQPLNPGQKVQVPGLTKSCSSSPQATGCRSTPLPAAKPLSAELETADYGAYTTTEVTYNCDGNLAAFCSRFLRPR